MTRPVCVDVYREAVAERVERTVALTRAGRVAREIAGSLRVDRRTVVRYRADARRRGLLPPLKPRRGGPTEPEGVSQPCHI